MPDDTNDPRETASAPGTSEIAAASSPSAGEDALVPVIEAPGTQPEVTEARPTEAPVTEAIYRSIVEGSLQGIIIQQDDRIVYANPAMAEMFGYANPSEMIGLDPFDDLIADQDLEQFRARTSEVYQGGRIEPHPGWRARHLAGKTVWLTSTAQRTQWQGRAAVASFYLDITDRRSAELALRESEARYRSALVAGRLGAWETDLIARTRTWTEEGMALFGLSLPDCRGQVGGDADEYAAAIHPDDRHLVDHYREQADSMDSFPAEYRIVRSDGAVLWLSGRGRVVGRACDGRAQRLISVMADITERKMAELHVQFLVKELAHRSKNLLSVIRAIARQTARTANSLEHFDERFQNRLQGLAASQDVLLRQDWRGAKVGDIVAEQLVPFVDAQSSRVQISGGAVMVTADAAQAIGLAIHELATNAVKHGALSDAAGTVGISWTFSHDTRNLKLCWRETGGPPVSPPTRKGFGHVVLQQLTSAALGGEVEMTFATEGMIWTATVPASNLLDGQSSVVSRPPVRPA